MNAFLADDPQAEMQQLMRKVRTLATGLKSRLPISVDENSLISAGYLGITQALANWQGGSRIEFEAQALRRATGAMLHELRKADILSRRARQRIDWMCGTDVRMNELETSTYEDISVEELSSDTIPSPPPTTLH